MPLIKTQITEELVLSFLKPKYFTNEILLKPIKGGELSQAFSFEMNGIKKIIRFNITDNECFIKDKICYEMFSKFNIPIPQILEIGKFQDYNYAISEFIAGQTLEKLNDTENLKITSKLFDELIKINNIPIQANGYGFWRSNTLNSKYANSYEWAISKLKYEYWEELRHSEPYFDTKLMNNLAKEVLELIKYIPDERYMVHGDFGFSNILSDGQNITGIIDWTECMYGDFLYDICWLQFWSEKIDYLDLFCKYNSQLPLNNYYERSRLYLLLIAIGSMKIFAESHRPNDYQDCINVLKRLKILEK